MLRHQRRDVHLARPRRRSLRFGGRKNGGDLDDGDVVGNGLDGLDESGGNNAAIVLGAEADLAALEVGDIDEAGGAGGAASSLEHGGG